MVARRYPWDWAKQSRTHLGGPAWQRACNRTVLCWSGMTDTKHYRREEREQVSETKMFSWSSTCTANIWECLKNI